MKREYFGLGHFLPWVHPVGIVKLTAVGENRLMESLYRRHRFPPEVISHAVWLYHRSTLSFRDVEDLLAQRGVTGSYEISDAEGKSPAHWLPHSNSPYRKRW